MASDAVVRARINGQVKEKAAKVLADMGLSVSDAIPAAAGPRGCREGAAFRDQGAEH